MRAIATPLWTAIPSLARPKAPWICRQCLRAPERPAAIAVQTTRIDVTSHILRAKGARAFSSSTKTSLAERTGKITWRERVRLDSKERRRVAIGVTALFLLGSGALAFSSEARHIYIAAERCGRVVVTLYLNIRDYLHILKQQDSPTFQADLSEVHKRCAQRTLKAMEKNGSIFIKLGQHLTSLNYLLPSEWCETFIPLQDKCPVSSFRSIEQMVKADTGKSLEDYFSEFAAEPIGAASLAQVHLARIRETGEKVAVKVQHPGLDEWASLDMWLTRFSFRTLKYWFPEYDLTWLSEEMEVSLPKELDFREEAYNARRTKAYFANIPSHPLIVPTVLWAERRVLVMEFITGHRPDDLEFLDANGISRDEVSAALARIFNEMIFGTDAPLHCDPHGGNMAIRLKDPSKRSAKNFEVILYDHGLYRDIPLQLRRAYAHMWLAVLETDIPSMRHWAYEIAGVGDEEFPIFASAITGRDFSVVTSNVVTDRHSPDEQRSLSESLGQDLIEKLVGLLARVPRVILLVLKTNDLTRSLDENLHTTQGPMRSFMILARYAARCVWDERKEEVKKEGSVWWPQNMFKLGIAALAYAKVAVKLRVYEYWLSARRVVGLSNDITSATGIL
ncbi:related to bacterial aminoglycoside acetyltransferase regulators [Ramularia collo-cygni]|uniref:Related to bacterial aminoglycoside acetyltransferase regulators n=1 Tax=Ramularia collo-cygni TaxID=112498 RepID=A0A2D3UP44_9PEZI|nr:related to bacterial aminoglycoside acetyltransferase regulators [Ramularia collo-cygni]CZT16971.1 related to bacterial aminoglycoside acetyltransferase regulators [Ramularia collo-cygni]